MDSFSTFRVTALANLLAEALTNEELAFVATLLTQLSDTLMTIVAQSALCAARQVADAPSRPGCGKDTAEKGADAESGGIHSGFSRAPFAEESPREGAT